MKCFNHPTQDAVGSCKECQKGLCVNCFSETKLGLTCNNKCDKALYDRLESHPRILLGSMALVLSLFVSLVLIPNGIRDWFTGGSALLAVISLGTSIFLVFPLLKSQPTSQSSTGEHLDHLEAQFQKLENGKDENPSS